MRFVSRLAATAAIGSALAVAPLASANPTHGFSNADGTVTCDATNVNGTYISCLSSGARETRPECNPPNELVPQFSYYAGRSHAGCWNQGMVAEQFKHLQPGQIHQFNEVTVVADNQGGLHFVGPKGYLGYAGKKAVSGPEGMGSISSRAL